MPSDIMICLSGVSQLRSETIVMDPMTPRGCQAQSSHVRVATMLLLAVRQVAGCSRHSQLIIDAFAYSWRDVPRGPYPVISQLSRYAVGCVVLKRFAHRDVTA